MPRKGLMVGLVSPLKKSGQNNKSSPRSLRTQAPLSLVEGERAREHSLTYLHSKAWTTSLADDLRC
jgi:hypothetical protein